MLMIMIAYFLIMKEMLQSAVSRKHTIMVKLVLRKPISCELFPIRVYGENCNDLRYEKSYFL